MTNTNANNASDLAGSAPATQPDAVSSAKRLLDGLQAGRIVNYVLLDKSIRPLLVLDPLDGTGKVDGDLFFMPATDLGNLPEPLTAGPSGHVPEFVVGLRGVPYDPSVGDADDLTSFPTPGTWHWPKKPAVMAAGIDAVAINVLALAAVSEILESFRAEILQTVNQKLETTVTSVNALLEPPAPFGGKVEGAETGTGKVVRFAEPGPQAVADPAQVSGVGQEASQEATGVEPETTKAAVAPE